jgi:membrane protein
LFLDSSEVRLRLDNFIADAVPGGAALIIENIDTIIRLRGPVGTISVGVLLWSASKMVGAMTRGVNFALGQKRNYAFFLSPLRNFGLTVTVSVLLLIAMSVSPVAELLSDVDLGWPSEAVRGYLHVVAGGVASFAITFAVLWSVYLLIPYKRPSWSALLPGTLVATLLFDLGRRGFVLYVGNASRFDAVYGSLSSIIVLLIWLYFSSRFLLYGSEVIAVRENAKLERPDPA